MKHARLILAAAVLVVLVAAIGLLPMMREATASVTPVVGGVTAKAASAVVSGRFVKLTAAGAVAHATAVGDSIVGVCDLTQATTNAMTRYAPLGTQTTVTSGEAIAVGDLLTGGTAGKAFVLDADDTSTQRYGAVALTAAGDADVAVTCIVQAGTVEQRLAAYGTTTSAADSLAIPVTHAIVVKTTGADAEALTLAAGAPGQILVITIETDGGGTGTLTPANASGWSTIVFADAGDTATLLYVDGAVGWVILGAAGTAAPPAMTQ